MKEKPIVTDVGVKILEYIKSKRRKKASAQELAEEYNTTGDVFPTALAKLVRDGFLSRNPHMTPTQYSLTAKGKEFDLEKYKKEKLNNEE